MSTINYQNGWRQCARCYSLYFPDSGGEGSSRSYCIGGVQHVASPANKFKVPFVGRGHKGQLNWRWCSKCSALFFNGHNTKGFCSADMAGHSSQGSGNYELKHTTDPEQSNLYGWRWCRKCEQLFYCPFYECTTSCAAGKTHDGHASGYYYVDSDA